MNRTDEAPARATGSTVDGRQPRTYYGQPVVKEPEWTWEVPWYLFAGGLAGACSGLAAAARATQQRQLADRAGAIAALAAVASPALLVADLGRPKRFLNMLRVFKPTSAMSMGSWLLSAYAPLAAGAATLHGLGFRGALPNVTERAAAALGMGMATYTAVLVSDSSIPVWHEARAELPFVFAGSAAASAGGMCTLLVPPGQAAPARRLALGGALVELAATELMHRRLGALAAPYEHGDSGRWQQAAKACTTLGAGLLALSGRSRRVLAATGAALVTAGSLCQRWAVYRAGFVSAADPAHTVTPQRVRLERGEGHRAPPTTQRPGTARSG